MKCWFVVHRGEFLRLEMLRAQLTPLASVDECHATRDADAVYTYLHFRQHVVRESLGDYLVSLKEIAGIVLLEFMGCNCVASAERIAQHVGFKLLLRHYQIKDAAFRPCTDGRPVVTRGLLWRSASLAKLRRIARNRQLGEFFKTMEQEMAGYKEKAAAADLMRDQLAEYEAVIERRGEIMRAQTEQLGDFWHLQFVTHVLQTRIRNLSPEQQHMMLAPDHRGRPLFRP